MDVIVRVPNLIGIRGVFSAGTSPQSPPDSEPVVYDTPGSEDVTVPNGYSRARVQCWGAGGGGGGGENGANAGGGGGGGAYAESTVDVLPGTSVTIVVGLGGASGIATEDGVSGTNSSFGSAVVVAAFGSRGSGSAGGGFGGKGGGTLLSTGTIKRLAGAGANKVDDTTGGGGGSSAGPAANGNPASGATGGVAVTGGGAGADSKASPSPGGTPGGGGAGAGDDSTPIGSSGGNGQVILTWKA